METVQRNLDIDIDSLLTDNYDLVVDDKVTPIAKMLYVSLFNLNQVYQSNSVNKTNYDTSLNSYLPLINPIRNGNLFSIKELR